ncbi:hypothetical protein JTE90_004244 [Oedothorax gibbosus]|uniref:Uncharacterized protein n=1 Tax=Oedothorax gibbosus TaxID=931172 RepID=A0AAV6TP26_9ARAC|nr:hypothetical protein JTE90_004244 [Oedothorax gibbosus]
MATHVVTVQEIIETASDLYSQLEEKAKSLKDQKPNDAELIQKAREHVEDLFQSSAEADSCLEDEEELLGIFGRIEGKFLNQRDEVKKGFKELDKDKRKEVIKFWKAVADFLGDVLNWLGFMFNYVLEKIRKGCKIVKDAVSGLFKTIYDFLKNIF